MEEKPLQVLLIEDNPDDFRLIQEMFKKSRANVGLKWAKQLSTGLANLKEEIFDGLLVDLGLPDSQGIDTFKKIHDQAPQIPIIVLTGLADDGLALRAVREGAQDYLIKGQTDSNLLIRTIHYAIERKRAEEETRLHENCLKNLLDLHRMGDATEKEIFDFTLEAGLRTVPSEFAFVGIISADEAVMIIHAWSRGAMGQCAITEKPIHFPIAEAGLWGEIVRQRRPIIVNDYNTSTEFKKGYPEGHVPIKRFLGIPVFSADRIVAVAAVANKVSEYTESDVSSLTSLLHEMWNLIDRKQAEEALKKSEEKYRTILENIEDGYFEVDIAGNFTFFNGSLCQILGYSRDEMMGMNNRQYTDNENAPKLYQAFNKVYRTGGPAKGFDWEIIRKDGIKRYIEASVSLIKDSSGQPIGFRGIVLDITERKQVEESLRESEKRYRQVIENATEIIYSLNTKGNFTYGNPAGLKVTGFSLEELRQFNYQDLIVPEHRERITSIYIKQFRERQATTYLEFPFFNKSGEIIWFGQNASLVIEDGKVVGFHIIARDITEHKNAEKALQESENRYRTLVENSNDGIALVKGDIHLYVNQKFLEIFGYNHIEEIVGRPISLTIHPNDRDRVVEMNRRRQTKEGEPSKYEFKGIRKDGSIVYIEVAATKTTYQGEAVSLSYHRDITERKRAEEEMAVLQEQFRQSQKIEAIGRLAGGIAHDFNNLLTVIKGYSQLSLVEIKEGDPLRGNIEEIKNAADRAADLTHQLLAFSRRQIMEMKVLDLNDLLKNLDKMLRRVIGEDIELVTLLAEDLGRVKTDPGQIEQVIMNLSVNTRDAMPEGGKLTIETANVELDGAYARNHVAVTPGRYVMISVSDTGVGMAPEVRDRVFDPFFTTKEKGKGTGLGLSTVYGIVKQSDGNIWVYSEPGKGTTFKIYLPRVDEPLEELGERVEVKEIPRGTETILVVEDEEDVRKLAVRILERQGYKVLEASQGLDAFLIAEKYEDLIHLLVTDVVMPKISGRELADRIAEIRPEIKVLYMSGYTDNTIVHHGVLGEGMKFIQKPFTLEGLVRKVREVLDK